MNDGASHTCPLCGLQGEPDGRRPALICSLTFRSITCDAPMSAQIAHPFPVRWLETHVKTQDQVEQFEQDFVGVRGPLEEGTAIAEAFDDRDPTIAWPEVVPTEDGFRVLIRL